MGLQTALRGLIAQQEALDITGHNIANANTLGYSRQEVTTSASRAHQINTGSSAGNGKAELGTGVDVDGVSRARDRFLDLQYRAQAMRLGGLATRVQGLETIEGALAEPGETGISSCRPSGKTGKGSPTAPKTPPPGRPWSKRARRSASASANWTSS
jgi:flagellar hook-associated protein 1 FlgK